MATYRIVTRDYTGGRLAATCPTLGDAEVEADDTAYALLADPDTRETVTHVMPDANGDPTPSGYFYTRPGGRWWSVRIYRERGES